MLPNDKKQPKFQLKMGLLALSWSFLAILLNYLARFFEKVAPKNLAIFRILFEV